MQQFKCSLKVSPAAGNQDKLAVVGVRRETIIRLEAAGIIRLLNCDISRQFVHL